MYLRTHNHRLLKTDLATSLLSAVITTCAAAWARRALLLAAGEVVTATAVLLGPELLVWIMPLVHIVLVVAARQLLARHREALWLSHRVLSAAAYVGAALQLLGGCSGAAADMTAATCARLRAALLRLRVVSVLANSLGLRLRFHVQCAAALGDVLLCLLLTAAAALGGALGGAALPLASPAAVLRQILVCGMAPTAIVYLFDAKERASFGAFLRAARVPGTKKRD